MRSISLSAYRRLPFVMFVGLSCCSLLFGNAFAQTSSPAPLPKTGVSQSEPPSDSGLFALPTDQVLANLISETLSVRPELASTRAAASAERERVQQAGALSDPMIQVGIQNDGFSRIQVGKMETSFVTIMGTQAFPWPGKRDLRTDIASFGARQADAVVERVRLSTEADVRRTYLDLLLARDKVSLLDQLESIWQKSSDIARVRYETGEGAQSDVLRSQLELNRIKQRRWFLLAEEYTSLQTLNRFRAHPLDEPINTSTTLSSFGKPELGDGEAVLRESLARSPEISAAHLGVSQAEKSVALARKGYYPDVAVIAGIMPRGGQFPTMWQAGLAFSVPLYAERKQSRAVAEIEARVLSGQKNIEAAEQVLRLRIRERRTAFAALLDTIRLYDEGLLVQSKATAETTLSQYRVGRVPFAAVLEANIGYINDQDGYLQALAEAHRLAIASAEISMDPVVLSPGGGGMGNATLSGARMSSSGSASMPKSTAGASDAAPESSPSNSKM